MSEWPSGSLHLSVDGRDPGDADVRMVPDLTDRPPYPFAGHDRDDTADERHAAHIAAMSPPDPPGTSRVPRSQVPPKLVARVLVPHGSSRPACRGRARRSAPIRRKGSRRCGSGTSRGDPDDDLAESSARRALATDVGGAR